MRPSIKYQLLNAPCGKMSIAHRVKSTFSALFCFRLTSNLLALSLIVAVPQPKANRESYPKVIIRACGTFNGRKSLSHSAVPCHLLPAGNDHVLVGCPLSPWIATTLSICHMSVSLKCGSDNTCTYSISDFVALASSEHW